MIRLNNASKVFQSNWDRVTAIEEISLTIPKGKVTFLAGANGSGKTTLLSLMSGILSPSSGRVYFDGLDISRLPERFLSKMRRERIGIIFQERHLVLEATVKENLTIPLTPTGLSHRDIQRAAKKMLSRFGLENKSGQKAHSISGGQKQRLIIARALINNPDVILADEPTTHLDQELLDLLGKDIIDWKNKGKTVVIATHDPALLKGIDTDLIIRLDKGGVEAI